MEYYLANMRSKGWVANPVDLSFFDDKEKATICHSRLFGEQDKILFIEGTAMAHLFFDRADQIAYLIDRGWLKAD